MSTHTDTIAHASELVEKLAADKVSMEVLMMLVELSDAQKEAVLVAVQAMAEARRNTN